MIFQDIYEKTKYAFENNEVLDLLIGRGTYEYQAPKYIASVPTCDEFIFRNGIYPVYRNANEQEKENIIKLMLNAIRKMMRSDNAVERWWALSICYGMKLSESKYKTAPFFISDELLSEIAPFLLEKKNELLNNQQYMGGNCKYGLWEDVIRYDMLLKEYFNLSVFK